MDIAGVENLAPRAQPIGLGVDFDHCDHSLVIMCYRAEFGGSTAVSLRVEFSIE